MTKLTKDHKLKNAYNMGPAYSYSKYSDSSQSRKKKAKKLNDNSTDSVYYKKFEKSPRATRKNLVSKFTQSFTKSSPKTAKINLTVSADR